MTHQIQHPIRVLIADNHEMICEGLRSVFKKQKNIQLVGEASNGSQLIKMAEELVPDVVIADIKMPEMDGVEATTFLTSKMPDIAIIAFTIFGDESFIVDMLEAGARGFLVKNSPKEEILDAIIAVHEGKNYYCSQTNEKLIHMIAESRVNPRRKTPKPIFRDKELEIIKLICQAKSNREISQMLQLNIRTIEGYRDGIHEKMKVTNTAGVVIYAIKNGIYELQ